MRVNDHAANWPFGGLRNQATSVVAIHVTGSAEDRTAVTLTIDYDGAMTAGTHTKG